MSPLAADTANLDAGVLATMLPWLTMLLLAMPAVAAECPGVPRSVVGTVYCDKQFTLWVNSREVATDPVVFTPQTKLPLEQALSFVASERENE